MICTPEMTNPAVRKNYVRIKNLPGLGMDSAGTDRRAPVVTEPANEIVSDVFGIFFHMSAGLLILIIHLYGV